MSRIGRPMKKKFLFKINLNIIVIAILLASIILLSSGCGQSTPLANNNVPSSGWNKLYEDEEWVQSVNQYLSLAYVKMGDQAAFTALTSDQLSTSLYATYSVIRMMKPLGINIEDRDNIIKFINLLKNQDGAYLEASQFNHVSANETMQAITVLNELGSQPEDIDKTVKYLLSLEYDDGTFLDNPGKEVPDIENTRLRRITLGTGSVIQSLVLLGQADKIPQKTKNSIIAEVNSALGEDLPFPDLNNLESWKIITAIELLAKIDPASVTPRAREYAKYALTWLVDMPADPYVFPSRSNRLLDIISLIGLSRAEEENIQEKLRVYLKDKIFPLENQSGGFGPSKAIEPLTTSEVLILANRLGVEVPDIDKIKLEINKHWVGNGWVNFYEFRINPINLMFTYYALEIAEFSGYDDYDTQKINRFLRSTLSGNGDIPPADLKLMDIYYGVMALKAMNGGLSSEDSQNAKALCLKLADGLKTSSKEDYSTQFAYASLISREVGFELPEEIKAEIYRLAGYLKGDMENGKKTIAELYLSLIWESQDKQHTILTRDEIVKYLESLYDNNSGAYTIPTFSDPSSTPKPGEGGTPTVVPRPEVYATYLATELLLETGESIPNRDKMFSFIDSGKKKYGFTRIPGLSSNTDMESTFAALMILKDLN
jgi:hypothetical protein